MADHWIERYLNWLEAETARLGGGQISMHYVRVARINYIEFLTRREPAARFRTWLAIRTSAGWLAQLSGRAKS